MYAHEEYDIGLAFILEKLSLRHMPASYAYAHILFDIVDRHQARPFFCVFLLADASTAEQIARKHSCTGQIHHSWMSTPATPPKLMSLQAVSALRASHP